MTNPNNLYNMRYRFFMFLLMGILLISCETKVTKRIETGQEKTDSVAVNDYSIQAVIWQQQAAEYKALCLQAYNLAELRLAKILAESPTNGKPLAIITDIDETVLDNSPYNAKLIKTGNSYTKETWMAWGAKEEAAPVPGALAFFKYAAKNDVEVYYISDRYVDQKNATINNLKKIGFPHADTLHVLLKREGVDKEVRRKKVLDSSEVVMYLGDNLSDFSMLFDHKKTAERNHLVDSLRQHFGNNYIVLPNPMYGAWLTHGIYEGNYKWNPVQKDSILRSKLKGY